MKKTSNYYKKRKTAIFRMLTESNNFFIIPAIRLYFDKAYRGGYGLGSYGDSSANMVWENNQGNIGDGQGTSGSSGSSGTSGISGLSGATGSWTVTPGTNNYSFTVEMRCIDKIMDYGLAFIKRK